MESNQVKQIVEALLLMSDQALKLRTIKEILGEVAQGHDIEQLVNDIGREYAERNSPIELRFIAEGWQFSTKKEFSPFIRRLYKERTMLRLSNSALETLSIIAYKQPITRSDMEEIRGVEITSVLETLLERKLVHIVGRKETIGRPLLYGTTTEFLRHFGLGHLSELPAIEEVTPPEETLPEAKPDELEQPVQSEQVNQEIVSAENPQNEAQEQNQTEK